MEYKTNEQAVQEFGAALDVIQEAFLNMSMILKDQMFRLEADIAKVLGLNSDAAAGVITGRIAEKFAEEIVRQTKQ